MRRTTPGGRSLLHPRLLPIMGFDTSVRASTPGGHMAYNRTGVVCRRNVVYITVDSQQGRNRGQKLGVPDFGFTITTVVDRVVAP